MNRRTATWNLFVKKTPTEISLTIAREELEKSGRNNPSAEKITLLLEKVLKLNNFTFCDLNYTQIKGTAMGTRASPYLANVYMGRFEDRFVYQAHWCEYVMDSGYGLLTTYL